MHAVWASKVYITNSSLDLVFRDTCPEPSKMALASEYAPHLLRILTVALASLVILSPALRPPLLHLVHHQSHALHVFVRASASALVIVNS